MSADASFAQGRLHALSHAYSLDGRITFHPPEARGFAPMNTFVLNEGADALLVHTGISAHAEALIDGLAAVVGPQTRLSLLLTRIGEYTTICNAVPIAERFGISVVYSEWADAGRWLDFRPAMGREVDGVLGALERATVRIFHVPDTIAVGRDGARSIDVFHATLRLLPTSWVYDPGSRTLFTSDLFTHVVRDDPDGPWVVTEDNDDTSIEWMRRHLLSTRYWWLAGARTDEIRESLAETFARYDIETIAPDFGCILHGRQVVRRHWEMLAAILAEAQEMAPVPMARGAVPLPS